MNAMPDTSPPNDALLSLSTLDPALDRVAALRDLIPEAFSDGQIDFDRLKAALGVQVASGRERYGLAWAGKADAVRSVQIPSTGTLVPDRKESVDFDKTSNVFAEGDNLEVLKLLQKSYHGKVKLIYIDPPYNTGHEFIYPDNFREGLADYLRYSGQVNEEGFRLSANTESDGRFHSKWLSMMWPRLFIARTLLAPEGSIWISIDDHEQAGLRALCSEIFGEENYVATFVWEKRTTRENRKVFSTNHDYIVCYARDADAFQSARQLLPLNDDVLARYENPDKDPRGEWQSVSLNAQGGHATAAQFYAFRLPSGRTVEPPPGRCWSLTKEKMKELAADNRIWFGASGDNVPRRKVFLSEAREGLTPHTLWTAEEVGTNDSAKKDLIKLFDGVEAYDTPKPIGLIRRIAQIAAGPEDLVLDFFAGSGTTAEAIIQANAQDGGSRRFIAVQLPEPVGEERKAAARDLPTISAVCAERIRRALARTQPQLSSKNLDVGFRFLRLTSSNFKLWGEDKPVDSVAEAARQISLLANNLKPGRSEEDILFELLLKTGHGLAPKMEVVELAGKRVYRVGEGELCICLADPIDHDVLRGIATLRPRQVLCLDHAFRNNDQDKVNARLELRAHGIELRTA